MKTIQLILFKKIQIVSHLFSMDISSVIINWYNYNKRDLPWRQTNDPYLIWVSEIIMQQTRINQGLPYYNTFIETFPTIQDLANANEESLLKIWQGLGYYSRARNMHFTAKYLINKCNGTFPTEYKELLKLKGIGKYTAAAIASFCFNEQVPAIDGNVNRVISRLFDISEPVNKAAGQKIISDISYEIIDKLYPNTFNQAMMDFGALVCTPQNPKCFNCPLNNKCESLKNKTVANRPVKILSKNIKKRFFVYFIITDGTYTILNKRTANDIWKGLFEFPMAESDSIEEFDSAFTSDNFIRIINGESYTLESSYKSNVHKLSHQHIYACFYKLKTSKLIHNNEFITIKISELSNYAFPKLIENYLIDKF